MSGQEVLNQDEIDALLNGVDAGTVNTEPETVPGETRAYDFSREMRNDMLMILSGQTYASVSSSEGKEALRQRCLEAARAIVKEMQGDPAKVEALYFTSFVMQ